MLKHHMKTSVMNEASDNINNQFIYSANTEISESPIEPFDCNMNSSRYSEHRDNVDVINGLIYSSTNSNNQNINNQ